MKRNSTFRKVKITDAIRGAYENRDRTQDSTDPECPTRPPEFWEGAEIGRFYRPIKTQVSIRIDNEILEWLKSKGEGHLTRINEILRRQMIAERMGAAKKA
jgi:uncharacterized protein (DUF4415 family)